jgi:hypothetical protein
MAAKAENPEAKLQQAVGREIEIRLMQDFMNKQNNLVTCAKWEDNLIKKDAKAKSERNKAKSLDDAQNSKISNKSTRKERLNALYVEEEIMYEDELNMQGYVAL